MAAHAIFTPRLLSSQQMFNKMDADGNGMVDKQEALKFWGKNFAKARPARRSRAHAFRAHQAAPARR